MLKALKQGVYGSLRGKIGGLFLKKTFGGLKQKLDYNNKGGALFLGVGKPVIKAHGSSDARAFKNAIRQAANCVKKDVVGEISRNIGSVDSET